MGIIYCVFSQYKNSVCAKECSLCNILIFQGRQSYLNQDTKKKLYIKIIFTMWLCRLINNIFFFGRGRKDSDINLIRGVKNLKYDSYLRFFQFCLKRRSQFF